MFGPWPRTKADLSIDRLVGAIKSHGVSRALTISTVGLFHSYNDGNAETLAACQGKPELLPAATIDPRGYFQAMKIVPNLITQGFRLFRLFPSEQGWPLDHSVFEDILNDLEETSVPVMIKAAQTGDASAFGRSVGGKQHPLILEGVAFETLAETVSVMKKHDNIYVETHRLYSPGAIKFLADQIGADRIIFGSDAPRNSLAGALRCVRESGVNEADQEKILGGNIKRLLGG